MCVTELKPMRKRDCRRRCVCVAVLTVSDLPSFTRLGGTAHLFVEGERMRFAVNVESAQRGRLRLSSRLLSLAMLVKDDPNAAPH